jgi:hypothetical protein
MLLNSTTGKVVEIDLSVHPPLVWVESEDVWLPLHTFASRPAPVADELSAFEKPLGMGIPNKEGQLMLFS